ncbi:hypothetical protein CEK00_04560 [Stenotrophomonas maltophilia]|uniref:Uncharacterized protein n=1 Tax=Stenotrophomonas maltophilia TaxID=40324 RepID=A0A270NLX3_STEMA|nr:hypothetical protein [Stenotrophomonas maltophilia]PAM73123.1 hypothetical protein CEK00_04560 [Stenotrophomonas maltophilia]
MLEALFLATAKAAPASTAAASAGYDWKWLVPVATLILGFGLKWLQDHITEKDRRRHAEILRREQRYDALRMRRLDAERENLLALQPMVIAFMRAATDAYKLKVKSFGEGSGAAQYLPEGAQAREDKHLALAKVEDELRESSAAIIPLHARIHSEEVRAALNHLVDIVWEAMGAQSSLRMTRIWSQVDQPHNELHTVMGRVIKHLEDENQQLGDPSAR